MSVFLIDYWIYFVKDKRKIAATLSKPEGSQTDLDEPSSKIKEHVPGKIIELLKLNWKHLTYQE